MVERNEREQRDWKEARDRVTNSFRKPLPPPTKDTEEEKWQRDTEFIEIGGLLVILIMLIIAIVGKVMGIE